MKVREVEKEEKITQNAMAEGLDESNEGDELLALFFSTEDAEPAHANQLPLAEPRTLFARDYDFSKAAFGYINSEKQSIDVNFSDSNQTLSLIAPDDLRYRFRYLPSEIKPEEWNLILTADKQQYQDEVKRSRQDETAWPKQHYLWSQHPVMQWLQERMLANVGRHTAPVLALNDGLPAGQSLFLISGLIPNRKAHPVIWQWYAVVCEAGQVVRIEDLHQTLKALQLGTKPMPNAAKPMEMNELEALRGPAIEAARRQVLQARTAFDTEMQAKLVEQTEELQRLHQLQQGQLELSLSTSRQETPIKEARRVREMRRIDAIFEQHKQWVTDTLNTEPMPYMQIIGVITRAKEQ